MNEQRTYLMVPFAEKDSAKALGARWDQARKSWYVPEGVEPSPFRQWLPSAEKTGVGGELASDLDGYDVVGQVNEEFDVMAVRGPFYTAESSAICWSCKTRTRVAALAAAGASFDGEPYAETVIVSNVRKVAPDLGAALATACPLYRVDSSKQAGGRYYMNHCEKCGAKIGDFFLHQEVDGCFSPTTEAAAGRLTLRRLPVDGAHDVQGQISYGVPNLIHLHARRS
jgi:hypothetical protein